MTQYLSPERIEGETCGSRVGKGSITYPCSRPRGHDSSGEPHYAIESESSHRDWSRWKTQQLFLEGTKVLTADSNRTTPVHWVGPEKSSEFVHAVDNWTPTKQRPEDQPLPTGDPTQPDIQSRVIVDIEERRQLGIQRYGQALQADNGRDVMRDIYEELIDAAMYVKQFMVERDEKGMHG